MLCTQNRPWLAAAPAVLILLTCGAARDAGAAGWSSGLQDARSLGMGNAFHAIANTPIALHFNPAGLTHINRDLGVQLGVHYPALLKYSADYVHILDKPDKQDPSSWKSEKLTTESQADAPVIPHLLVTSSILDRFMPRDFHLALGLGWYVPMGGGTMDFKDLKLVDGDSTTLSGFMSSMAIHYLSLGAAFSWKNWVSLGVNFNVHFADVALKQSNYPKQSSQDPYGPPTMIDNEFEGLGVSFSPSFGLMLQDPNKLVRVGVAYKMKYKVEAKGTTTFDVISPANSRMVVNSLLGTNRNLPITADTSVDFVIPHQIMAGISISPVEWFTISASIDYSLWSETEDLTLNGAGMNLPGSVTQIKVLSEEVKLLTGYDDVLTFMVGAELQALGDNLPIRVGYILNPAAKTPYANSVASVDTDSHIITYGAGYKINLPRNMMLAVDAGFYHLIGVSTGGSDEELQAFMEYIEKAPGPNPNRDADGMKFYSGPAGDYNKSILFGFIVDLTFYM